MKILSNKQIQVASAGTSYGYLQHLGQSYPIECPLVSQSCLNSYIHYLEYDFANQDELISGLFLAFEACDGPHGILRVGDCTKHHFNQIKNG